MFCKLESDGYVSYDEAVASKQLAQVTEIRFEGTNGKPQTFFSNTVKNVNWEALSNLTTLSFKDIDLEDYDFKSPLPKLKEINFEHCNVSAKSLTSLLDQVPNIDSADGKCSVKMDRFSEVDLFLPDNENESLEEFKKVMQRVKHIQQLRQSSLSSGTEIEEGDNNEYDEDEDEDEEVDDEVDDENSSAESSLYGNRMQGSVLKISPNSGLSQSNLSPRKQTAAHTPEITIHYRNGENLLQKITLKKFLKMSETEKKEVHHLFILDAFGVDLSDIFSNCTNLRTISIRNAGFDGSFLESSKQSPHQLPNLEYLTLSECTVNKSGVGLFLNNGKDIKPSVSLLGIRLLGDSLLENPAAEAEGSDIEQFKNSLKNKYPHAYFLKVTEAVSPLPKDANIDDVSDLPLAGTQRSTSLSPQKARKRPHFLDEVDKRLEDFVPLLPTDNRKFINKVTAASTPGIDNNLRDDLSELELSDRENSDSDEISSVSLELAFGSGFPFDYSNNNLSRNRPVDSNEATSANNDSPSTQGFDGNQSYAFHNPIWPGYDPTDEENSSQAETVSNIRNDASQRRGAPLKKGENPNNKSSTFTLSNAGYEANSSQHIQGGHSPLIFSSHKPQPQSSSTPGVILPQDDEARLQQILKENEESLSSEKGASSAPSKFLKRKTSIPLRSSSSVPPSQTRLPGTEDNLFEFRSTRNLPTRSNLHYPQNPPMSGRSHNLNSSLFPSVEPSSNATQTKKMRRQLRQIQPELTVEQDVQERNLTKIAEGVSAATEILNQTRKGDKKDGTYQVIENRSNNSVDIAFCSKYTHKPPIPILEAKSNSVKVHSAWRMEVDKGDKHFSLEKKAEIVLASLGIPGVPPSFPPDIHITSRKQTAFTNKIYEVFHKMKVEYEEDLNRDDFYVTKK